jgi:hypothetical protein
MRDEDAARFAFASDFVAGRVTAVKADMAALDGDLTKIASKDLSIVDPKSGTRNEFMKALSRKLDMTVSSFNALRTDPQLKQMRQDLADRADRTTFGDPKSGGFVCPDAELSQALRGAARAIGELPVLEKPTIAAVEGSEATIEAFRRLTATFYGLLSFKLPPSADELRELQKKAMQQIETRPAAIATEEGGLSKRDYVPLAVAIFVDICLFLVSIGRPTHRLHGLVPKMREAERGPVIEILSRFNDIHRDPEIRESFELFRHVVFDVHGAYYVAVPLDAPLDISPSEREELRTEAQLLANLFTSFEKDKIFRRTWTPFPGVIRKKLAKQGSKFAGSEAFRIYKFHDGAWSEFILGAVMGAARRAEAEANRRRIERDLLRPAEPSFRAAMAPFPEPTLATSPLYASARPITQPATQPAPAPTFERAAPNWAETRTPPRAAPGKPASHSTSDVFGPYARSAEAELNSSDRLDDEEPIQRPTNSNTAPSRWTEVVAPQSEPAAPRARVDVVLKRETATVTLPLDDTRETDGLIGRLGQALNEIEPEPKNFSAAELSSETATNERRLADNGRAIRESRQGEVLELVESVGSDISTDPATADAVTIAGRLRPAIGKT